MIENRPHVLSELLAAFNSPPFQLFASVLAVCSECIEVTFAKGNSVSSRSKSPCAEVISSRQTHAHAGAGTPTAASSRSCAADGRARVARRRDQLPAPAARRGSPPSQWPKEIPGVDAAFGPIVFRRRRSSRPTQMMRPSPPPNVITSGPTHSHLRQYRRQRVSQRLTTSATLARGDAKTDAFAALRSSLGVLAAWGSLIADVMHRPRFLGGGVG
ncbi:hypothetical protein HPB47_008306 [Ixodes persulcatus]|uniref:Uncharacterized protein n=1 Tax=Ixodes persulcatus TaxID=34615 RepID=A0AC60P518_IXOPE|nr:hypothetical protein HPB47_008306 [Ixodes persulcatus]